MIVLAIALTIGSLLLVALVAAAVLVLKDAAVKEAAAVIPECTRSLIRRAQDQLPEEARERFEEEWSAGFEEAIEKRPAWALMQAISLLRGARQIARELEPAPARTGAGGPGWRRGVSGAARIGQLAEALRDSRLRRWLAGMRDSFARVIRSIRDLVDDRILRVTLAFVLLVITSFGLGARDAVKPYVIAAIITWALLTFLLMYFRERRR